MINRRLPLFIISIMLSTVFTSVTAQTVDKSEIKERMKKRMSKIPVFNEKETSIKNPFDLRDPFKRKLMKTGEREKNFGGFLKDGKYSNLPTINDYPVGQIRIVGVLLGKERRAIARISTGGDTGKMSDESYIIKEGMTLGENNAEVKAIVPGGIVLVEKIRNVYDQDEYIETIIPVSSPSVQKSQNL